MMAIFIYVHMFCLFSLQLLYFEIFYMLDEVCQVKVYSVIDLQYVLNIVVRPICVYTIPLKFGYYGGT
jgi:hypothetical protein